jgi:hypothetical protein
LVSVPAIVNAFVPVTVTVPEENAPVKRVVLPTVTVSEPPVKANTLLLPVAVNVPVVRATLPLVPTLLMLVKGVTKVILPPRVADPVWVAAPRATEPPSRML